MTDILSSHGLALYLTGVLTPILLGLLALYIIDRRDRP